MRSFRSEFHVFAAHSDERGVEFPVPSTQGIDRPGRFRATVLLINFTHIDPGCVPATG